jgi:hypothetical protein
MKRQKQPTTGTVKAAVKDSVKRPVRAALPSHPPTANVHRNDPLAIGIEELERAFWPPARSRRVSP